MEIQLQQFPPDLQALLVTIQETKEPLTIVDNGQPLAVLSPLTRPQRAAFGCMQSSGTIDDDIVGPVIAPSDWEALQ